jgi:ubiquinone/menaquinone biosynthesis C-methylase UbiE
MDPTSVFSSKAEKYARYRWDYAPQAIEAIFRMAGLTSQSVVADVGAGSGILTRHFIGRVGQVLAIEPNPEMRQILERACGGRPGCMILDARAEATALPEQSLDLIVVGTAFNWFDPSPTRAEFRRILKPGGWLADLRNHATGPDFGPAMDELYHGQTDTLSIMKGADTPVRFYFGSDDFQRLAFPFQVQNDWPRFFGALASASYAPDEDHPLYPAFERGARAIFDSFNQDGVISMHAVTDLAIGQMGT